MIRGTTPEKKVAIFDIDGTIFRSSLLIELVEALLVNEVFPSSARTEFDGQRRKWVNREEGYEQYIRAVVETFMTHIKGVPYKTFMDISDRVVEENRYKTYRYTRDLLRRLKKEHYYLLAISQSPKGTLDTFCSSLGFDKVYGRVYSLGPEDRFTGEVEDLHLIANKGMIVNRAVEKEGLTLTDSVGVGDTEDDIPFLEKVTHPIAFNPNRGLYRQAQRNGWSALVERKDMVHTIFAAENNPFLPTSPVE